MLKVTIHLSEAVSCIYPTNFFHDVLFCLIIVMVFDCEKVVRNAVADSTNMKKRLFISLNFAQRYLTIIIIKSGFAYHFLVMFVFC